MPKLLTTPFAADAPPELRTDIQTSTGEAPNSATYQTGFPERTMLPITSGGIPPKGADMNGVLYDITGNIVFQQQGGVYGYDAAYATAIGGYPVNARLMLTNGDIVQNTVANNTNDPNVNMTGWVFPQNIVKPQSFGITSSTPDATELLRKMHNYANERNLICDYSGLKSVNVQADAKIIINSSVNFQFCEFKLLNSVKSSLSWSEPFNELFIVYDENFPLQDSTLNSSNLQEWYKGSLSFGRYTLNDGYLKLTFSNVLFPNRADDGTRSLVIPFCLNQGVSSVGLPFDCRGLVSGISVKTRVSPNNRLYLNNFLCNMNEPNKQTLFRIKRNKVDLDSSWIKTTDQNCINTLIFIDDAADVDIKRAEGRGSDNSNNVGTYSVYTFGAAKVKIQNMISNLGWGQLATHFTNDIRLLDSVSRRVDAHEQVFNFYGFNLELYNSIQYGNGGGNWHFENIKYSLNPNATALDAIAARSDYGKHFIGSITLKNSIFNCLDSTYSKLINFQSMGSASMLSNLPQINIDGMVVNITQTDANPDAYPNRFSLLHLTIDGSKQAKIFQRMQISNLTINSFDGFKFYALINFGMFVKNGDSPLEIKNLSTLNSCVFQPTLINNRLSTGYSTAKVNLESFSKNIKVYFASSDSGIKEYSFNGVYLTKCSSNQSDTALVFQIKNSIIDYYTTTDKLCGTQNATTATRDYSILDSVIIGDPTATNFSFMNAVIVRKYTLSGTSVSTVPTLPTGATIEAIYTGWKDATWYK